MKKLCIVTGVLLLLSVSLLPAAPLRSYSDDDIKQLIADAPGAESYPQASAIVLLKQVHIQYNEDFSAVTDEHLVVKILQDRARSRFGDQKRRYNEENDSIVLIKAVTHLTDGTIIPVEEKAINDITPAFLANAAIYSNVRQRVISFSGIAPGVTVELKLRKYSSAPEEGEEVFIGGTQLFQFDEPILYKEHSLTVPASVEIKYTYQNEGLEYVRSEGEGTVTHSWYVEHSPQIIEELFMPRMIKVAPRLIYSDASDWSGIGDWFAEKFYSHVVTDGKIKKKAKELSKGAKSRKDKITNISLFVIEEIRDVGERSLPLGLAGYEPHDADEVLVNRYGDWRDKAVLLVSLLKAAGVEAYPSFVHRSSPELAEKHPTLKQFDAILVHIPDFDGEPLWVDTFSDHCFFGYFPDGQASQALLVRDDGCNIIPTLETTPTFNHSNSKVEIYLKPNGDVEGSIACELAGYFDWRTRSRLKEATPKKVEQYFHTSANSIGEGSVNQEYKTSDLTNLTEPVRVAQSFHTPELAIVEGDMMVFHTPSVPFSFANVPVALGQEMRQYNFELNSKLLLETEGYIYLPDGYKAVYVAEPFTIENEYGSWSASYTINEAGDAIHYQSAVTLTDTSIDPEEYLEFKQSYDHFNKPKNTLILLERE